MERSYVQCCPFIHLQFCLVQHRKYTSKVYILLCRSYILMACSDFILAQPSTHSLLRCCDRAKYWTSAAVLFIFCECAYTHARYVFYYVVATYCWIVLILFLRSQLRIHYWDVVIVPNFERAAAYATNYAKARKVCILLCRSYILMDCSDFILAQPITH